MKSLGKCSILRGYDWGKMSICVSDSMYHVCQCDICRGNDFNTCGGKMAHKCNHNCKHKRVEFCKDCNKVYCKDCSKEWPGPYTPPTYYPIYPDCPTVTPRPWGTEYTCDGTTGGAIRLPF